MQGGSPPERTLVTEGKQINKSMQNWLLYSPKLWGPQRALSLQGIPLKPDKVRVWKAFGRRKAAFACLLWVHLLFPDIYQSIYTPKMKDILANKSTGFRLLYNSDVIRHVLRKKYKCIFLYFTYIHKEKQNYKVTQIN